MSALQPAQPTYGGGAASGNTPQLPAGTATPGFTAIVAASQSGVLPKGPKQFIINNKGTIWLHFYCGAAVRAATAGDLGIPPNSQQIYTRQEDSDINFSVIAPDGAGSSFQIAPCEGW